MDSNDRIDSMNSNNKGGNCKVDSNNKMVIKKWIIKKWIV